MSRFYSLVRDDDLPGHRRRRLDASRAGAHVPARAADRARRGSARSSAAPCRSFTTIFTSALEIAAPVLVGAADHRRRVRGRLAGRAADEHLRGRLPDQGGRRDARRRRRRCRSSPAGSPASCLTASARRSARCTWRSAMAREDRTEKATAQHRKRAREQGQVARSADLSGSLVLIAGLFVAQPDGARRSPEAGAASFRAILGQIARPGARDQRGGLSRTDALGAARRSRVAVRPDRRCLRRRGAARRRRAGRRSADASQALKPDFRRINPVSGAEEPARPQPRLRGAQGGRQGRPSSARSPRSRCCPGMNEPRCRSSGIPPGALGGDRRAHTRSGVAQRAAIAYVRSGSSTTPGSAGATSASCG